MFSVCALASAAAQPPRTVLRTQDIPQPARMVGVVEDLRIGDDDESLMLSFVKALLPRADGSVWVVDNSRGNSSIFSTTGSVPIIGTSTVRRLSWASGVLRIVNVGRSGSGPGEWQMPAGLSELPDGRVLLHDDGLPTRLTFFTAEGTLDTTWAVPSRLSMAWTDTAGLVWVLPPPTLSRNPSGVAQSPRDPRLLQSSGRDVGTAPPAPQLAPGVRSSYVAVGSGASAARLIAPYQGLNSVAWSPFGEYAVVLGDSALILRYPLVRQGRGTAGAWVPSDTVFRYRRGGGDRVPVSEQERREQRARLQQIAALAREPLARVPDIPTHKPYYSVPARFDHDGRLWIAVSVPSVRRAPAAGPAARVVYPGDVPNLWEEPTMVFEVFSRDFRLLGRVALPERAAFGNQLMPARGDVLWGVVSDADDVPTLVRYRLSWPGG